MDDIIIRTLGNLLLFFFVACWIWWRRNAAEETIKAAEVIRGHQGNHEAEVSCGGEGDLHKHCKRCKKNPGHSQFIPIGEFNIEHLPPGYQDNNIVNLIRCEAEATCRVLVKYTSANRPEVYPGRSYPYPFHQDRGSDFWRTGTGWLCNVEKYTEEDNKLCECEKCHGTYTPKKVWGKVIILTACHVVFDKDEVRHTTCYFCYDTSKKSLMKCLQLKGLEIEESYIKADYSVLSYVTHDMDIIHKLDKIRLICGHNNLQQRARDIAMNEDFRTNGVLGLLEPVLRPEPNVTPEPIVIISHPHGCSKMVTVGTWTDRQHETTEAYKVEDYNGFQYTYVSTSYSYNTPTCPGSSGAPIFRLPEKGKRWCASNWHLHSEGGQGNNNQNKSGSGCDMVSDVAILRIFGTTVSHELRQKRENLNP